jgi:uncharacterized protein YecE (DUF72 family)
MEFGKVAHPELIDFTLPQDDVNTASILNKHLVKNDAMEAYVGCAKWNRTDLKGFYPRGTKDELTYYATQFNSIELNATFYLMPSLDQVITWKNKTPDNFKFFPKLTNTISHYKRLNNVAEPITLFCDAISGFEKKLGMAFLQLHDNFGPKDFDKLALALESFPKGIPLAVEVRNEKWFNDVAIWNSYCSHLENLGIANIIVDTAGRRDMLHMRLTSPVAFVRFVGANHPTDIDRLNEWVTRLKIWQAQGLQKLYFFVHQNIELSSPLLATHFIQELNKHLGTQLIVPKNDNNNKLEFF